MATLEDLIRQKIPFVYKRAGTGFEPVICQVCGDYKPRGGFKFENGQIVYSCFNCGANGSFSEGDTSVQKRFKDVLRAFGISEEEIDRVTATNFFNNGGLKKQEDKEITLASLASKKPISHFTPEIKLPGSLYRVTEEAQSLWNYVRNRCILRDDLTFYGSSEEKYKDRVIIPFYRNGKVIFWQARSIDENAPERYLNPGGSREAIIYGYDELNRSFDLPLFVTEGVFDAIPVHGIALLGSKLNETKIDLLQKTRRRKVFVIDKDDNGKNLAEVVLRNGWEITFAPEGYDDVNKSVQQNGLSWTVYSLMNQISSGLTAQAKVKLYCRGNKVGVIRKAKATG